MSTALAVIIAMTPQVIEDPQSVREARTPGGRTDLPHAVPCAALACGGAGRPENMQWQTGTEGKAKWECEQCGR